MKWRLENHENLYKTLFLQVLNINLKNGKNDPVFWKSEAYASLLRLYRLLYDSLLISQMLKFKTKTRYETTRFSWKMRSIRPLRMSYGCLTDVLRMSYDSLLIIQILKFKIKTRYKCSEFRKNEAYAYFTDILRLFYDSLLIIQMLKFK